MLTEARAAEEVDTYRHRVNELYANVRQWIRVRHPDAVFSEIPVELSEESTGVYSLRSLEVSLPGSPAVRFLPRGIFTLGAHGRVDVCSRFGREELFWVEPSGPYAQTTGAHDEEPESMIGHSLFPGVEQGWALADSRRLQLIPLNSDVLWNQILARLMK